MKYVIYARKSQEREERQVQSIEDQLKLADEYCQRLGLPLCQPSITESFSAKEPWLRKEFERLVQLIEAGKVDGIVAWHPDRLSRNETDAATICRLLRQGQLKDLKFVSYFFDNSPEGMMMLQMALSQSQYFSSKLSKDVLRGLDSKIQKGWFPHVAPEGYFNDLEYHTIKPDPDRLPLVHKAFRLLLTGAYTVAEVTEIMNRDWGYRTRKHKQNGGKELTRTAAYRMFSNIFYTGRFVHKGEVVMGSHDAILTLEEFHEVQRRIKRGIYKKGNPFLFNGIMRCETCQGAVVGSLQKGRHGNCRYVYYACGNPKCPDGKRSIREDKLEEQIIDELRAVQWPVWFGKIVQRELRNYFDDEYKDSDKVTRNSTVNLANAERRRDSLLDMKLRGLIDDDQFVAKNAELKAEIEELRVASESAQNQLKQAEATINHLCKFTRHSYDTFKIGDVKKKQEVMAALGPEYRFRAGTVQIRTNPLLPHNFMLLEPLEIGSGNSKGTFSNEKVPFGWADGTVLEPLKETFRMACMGVSFPLIEYIE